MNIDTKNMETFIQVAELCSFTKAAKKLDYSQSTVSFQIRQLEEMLNVRLLERINHTVALTEAGRKVLNYAHRLEQLTVDMEKELRPQPSVSGHVRMALADSLACWILREHYENFRAAYPGITLKMATASTEELFRMLNQNETDLVYTLDHHVYNSDYIIGAEERIQAHFVAAPGFLPFSFLTVPVRELITFPFLLTEKGMSYRRLMDEHLARFSLEVRPVLEFGSADLLCTLVTQGAGVSFLPDYVTEAALKSGRLVRLSVPEFKPELWRQLLYHKDKWVSPAMQTVIEYFSGLSPAHTDASDHMLL